MLSHLGLFSDYLASFQWSQFLLSLCDKGLQAVETVVQVCSVLYELLFVMLIVSSKCQSVFSEGANYQESEEEGSGH